MVFLACALVAKMPPIFRFSRTVLSWKILRAQAEHDAHPGSVARLHFGDVLAFVEDTAEDGDAFSAFHGFFRLRRDNPEMVYMRVDLPALLHRRCLSPDPSRLHLHVVDGDRVFVEDHEILTSRMFTSSSPSPGKHP